MNLSEVSRKALQPITAKEEFQEIGLSWVIYSQKEFW
jgi:hypothetical protein